MVGGHIPTPPPSSRPVLDSLATSSLHSACGPPTNTSSSSAQDTPLTLASSTPVTPSSSVCSSSHHFAPSSQYNWADQHRSSLSASVKASYSADTNSTDAQQLGLQPHSQRSGSELSSTSWIGDDLFSESNISRQSSCETDVGSDHMPSTEVQDTQISMSPSKMSAPMSPTNISRVNPRPLRRRAVEISCMELQQRLNASSEHIAGRSMAAGLSMDDSGVAESQDNQIFAHVKGQDQSRVQLANLPGLYNFKPDTASTNSIYSHDTAAPPTHIANNHAEASDQASPLLSHHAQPSPSFNHLPPSHRGSILPEEDAAVKLARLELHSGDRLIKPFDSRSTVPPLILDLRPVELFVGEPHSEAPAATEATGHVRGSVNLLIPGLILRRWAKSVAHNQPAPSLQSFITTPMSKRRFSDIVNATVHARTTVPPSLRTSRNSASSMMADGRSLAQGGETDSYDQYWQSDIVILCDAASTSKGTITASPLASTSSVLIETLERTPLVDESQPRPDRGGGIYYLRDTMASLKSTLSPAHWSVEKTDDSIPMTDSQPSSHPHLIPNVVLGRSKTISAKPRSSDPEALNPALECSSTASNETQSVSTRQRPLLARIKTSELLGTSVSQSSSPSISRKSPSGLKLQVDTGIPKRSATLSAFSSQEMPSSSVADASRPVTQSLQSLCRAHAQLPPSREAFGDMCLAPGSRGTFTFSPHDEAESSALWGSPSKSAAPLEFFEISTILPDFLYLGPAVQTESDLAELQRKGVRRVLNVATEIEDAGPLNICKRFDRYLKVPMLDSVEAVGVPDSIRQACEFLNDAHLRSEPVYVHCKAGKSRSVTIVIAYLIHALRWRLNKAYAHVVERRSAISPNIGFVAELMKFEERELSLTKSSGIHNPGTSSDEIGTAHGTEQLRRYSDLGEASRSMPSLHLSPKPVVVLSEPTSDDAAPLWSKSSPDLAN